MGDNSHHNLKRLIFRGASGAAGLNAASTLLALVSGVLLARALGPDNYGLYVFVLSLITILGLPTNAGLPFLVVRETAKNFLYKRWGLLRGLLRQANLVVVCFSLLIGLSVVGVMQLTDIGGDWNGVEPLSWALLLLPIVALGNIRGATLRGFKKAFRGQLPEQLVKPLSLVLLLSVFIVLDKDLTPHLAILLNLVSALLAFFVGVWLLRSTLPPPLVNAKPEYEHRAWISSLVPLSMIAAMKLIDTQVVVLLLGSLASIDNVALFRVAAQGATLVAFGLTAVNLVLAPHVTTLYQEGRMEELQNLVTFATRIAFAIAVPVAIVLIVFGKPIVAWVFGEEYIEASLSLGILSIGQLINVSAGSVVVILNMAGYERETFKALFLAALVSITLTVVLVPLWQAVGAAFAVIASLSIWNVMMMRSVNRHIGLKTFVLAR